MMFYFSYTFSPFNLYHYAVRVLYIFSFIIYIEPINDQSTSNAAHWHLHIARDSLAQKIRIFWWFYRVVSFSSLFVQCINVYTVFSDRLSEIWVLYIDWNDYFHALNNNLFALAYVGNTQMANIWNPINCEVGSQKNS